MSQHKSLNNDDFLDLSQRFEGVQEKDWRDLVEKALKGADFNKIMRSQTYDQISVDALYTPSNTASATLQASRKGAWDIGVAHWHHDASVTNASILEDLERGATSLSLHIADGERSGLSPKDIERALEGVYLDLAPIYLRPGAAFREASEAYLDFLSLSGVSADLIKGNLGCDPFATFASSGRLSSTLSAALSDTITVHERSRATYPHLKTLSLDMLPYNLAGATEAQEVGIMLATAAAYLRAFEVRGIAPKDALAAMDVVLGTDADIFLTIAKYRAARLVWGSFTAACGAENAYLPLNGVSSLRMMTTRDPWVNILRATAACFAAGVGGADRVLILPHDSLMRMPDSFSRRIARNIQVILLEESHLGVVEDPSAGSFALETLSNRLAEKAWEYFQAIEARGGLEAALRSGSIQADIAEVWKKRAVNIRKRIDPVTGVSEFPDSSEKQVSASEPVSNNGAVLAASIDTIEPLPTHRFSEDYEVLRARSDQMVVDAGKRPSIFLANIGPAAHHTARATFAKNFFEAGGIYTLPSDGFDDAATLVSAFEASDARYAVLCGSDPDYELYAEAFAGALKAAGCDMVYFAGRPRDESALRAAGVDAFIHIGVDVVAVLEGLLDKAEVAA